MSLAELEYSARLADKWALEIRGHGELAERRIEGLIREIKQARERIETDVLAERIEQKHRELETARKAAIPKFTFAERVKMFPSEWWANKYENLALIALMPWASYIFHPVSLSMWALDCISACALVYIGSFLIRHYVSKKSTVAH